MIFPFKRKELGNSVSIAAKLKNSYYGLFSSDLLLSLVGYLFINGQFKFIQAQVIMMMNDDGDDE
jgi:hypothetical protein